MPKICAAVPAFNEADRIADTVKALLSIDKIDTVLVIDDGSNDDTAKVAETAGARVLRLSKNSGKGNAMNEAYKHMDADFYLFIDADLGECAINTAPLIDPLLSNDADMTIAIITTPKGHRGGFGFVKNLAAWGIKKYGKLDTVAPISGQRGISKKLIEAIGGFEEGFGVEVAMTIDATRLGFRIMEIPLELSHRISGRTLKGFIHRGKQFLHIARAIFLRSLSK